MPPYAVTGPTVMVDRKPPVKLESRETYTLRFKPSEWEEFVTAAAALGLLVRQYVRECALTGHTVEQARRVREGHTRVSA